MTCDDPSTDPGDGPVWTATEHPGPTALHVIVAHDVDALEQKIIEAELAS
jgi:hypothetical protein